LGEIKQDLKKKNYGIPIVDKKEYRQHIGANNLLLKNELDSTRQ
jgi:hypothetical protein